MSKKKKQTIFRLFLFDILRTETQKPVRVGEEPKPANYIVNKVVVIYTKKLEDFSL